MDNTQSLMEHMFDKLNTFLKTETVIGEPFTIGSVTLIPIISVSFGMGGGLGEGKDSKGNDGGGGGGGLGCRISPNAILVVKDDEVNLIQLKSRGSLEKLFEVMPELISKLDLGKDEKGEGE